MKKLMLGCAISALATSAAFAQSTGSVDFDNTIVVTGSTASKGVAGVVTPDTSKAKAVLTQEFITRQTPGQSINDIINQLPGVSFMNNDGFGSAGGKLFIRGFDNTRISQTFDGIPLNDSGGYQIYSSQQLDSELIDQVNVNLGSTDVDSPTAAATGSTVNYRTRLPTDDFHARIQGTAGDFNFFRMFGVVDTGVFTPWGTKAFFSASHSENDNVFNNRGKIDKQQYNARIYQPIGSNGDFISVAGHYSESRNNFFGSVPLRADTTAGRIVPNRFPLTKDERYYTIARCQIDTPQPGVADAPNTCGSTFDERYNPSNTGNIRIASRFTLSDGLVLTVDPSYQYVKANGGGTVTVREGSADINPAAGAANVLLVPGFIGGSYYAGGKDLNADGDQLDQIRALAPSQTQTHRYGVIASLRYDINEHHTVRVAYSFDRARHRQTGEVGFLQLNGQPFDVFPVNDPIIDASGNRLQKRDRLSYAILNQFSGEYRGEFLEDKLTVNAGVRAPFFKRDLTNYCFTTSAAGFLDCFGGNSTSVAAYQGFNPYVVSSTGAITGFSPPQKRVLKYDKILPNVGFTLAVAPRASLFGSYSKGLQVPGTDNLYNSFYFPATSARAKPNPETTDNFDLGVRYRSGKIQAQTSIWYTSYKDRLASAYDPELDRTVYRNLGSVEKYGVDGSISYAPIPEVQFYVFGSYLKSKIKEDVQVAELTNGTVLYAPTAGNREAGAPIYTVGGRVQGSLGPLDLGVQVKRTGERYVYDSNEEVRAIVGGVVGNIYNAKVPAYTLVDLDARLSLEFLGLNDRTWLQVNVTNVFDKLYVGGFDGNLNQGPTFNSTTGAVTAYGSAPNVQIGAPRTFTATIVVGF